MHAPWESARGFSLGAQWDTQHGTRRQQARGGQVYADRGSRQRRLQFTLQAMSQSEAWNNAEAIDRINGIADDVLICLDKDSIHLDHVTIWGLIENRSPLAWAALLTFRRDWVVTERL